MPGEHRRYHAEVWDLMQLLFGKFNDHQLRGAIRLDGRVDESRLARAVDLSADAFPIIRCKFVEGPGRPYWEDAGFTASDMVHCEETGQPEETIQRLLVARTHEGSGPQLRIDVVRGNDADALCVLMNHMVCDAAGFKEYLYLLSSIYAHLAGAAEYRPDYVMGSRSCAQVLRALNWRDRARTLFDEYRLSKHSSGVLFELDGDPGNPFIVSHTLSREKFRSIKACAKQHGATVNDIVLAAYMRSLKEVLGRALAIPCTVDLRKYLPGRQAQGICNLSSQLICDIGEDIGEGPIATLIKVKQAMDADKGRMGSVHGVAVIEAIFGLLPYATAMRLMSHRFINPSIALTNIGIIDKERLYFGDIDVTQAFITGSIKYKPYFQVALSSFDDELTFTINFHGTDADKERIGQFLRTLDGELLNGHEGAAFDS
jgi:NRPS condensation-like uncharacterized protein